jgi:hypothetical protein
MPLENPGEFVSRSIMERPKESNVNVALEQVKEYWEIITNVQEAEEDQSGRESYHAQEEREHFDKYVDDMRKDRQAASQWDFRQYWLMSVDPAIYAEIFSRLEAEGQGLIVSHLREL